MAASSSRPPCAGCTRRRKKCEDDCVLAPYFPQDQKLKFENVFKIYGFSKLEQLLKEVPEHQREEAAKSLVFEAGIRIRDPVHGCCGAIAALERQIAQSKAELHRAHSTLVGQENAAAAGGLIAVPGNASQGQPSSSLGIEKNLLGIESLSNELPEHQWEEVFKSLVPEADAGVQDPVHGFSGAIPALEHRQAGQVQAYAAAEGMTAVPGNVRRGLASSFLGIETNSICHLGPQSREEQRSPSLDHYL